MGQNLLPRSRQLGTPPMTTRSLAGRAASGLRVSHWQGRRDLALITPTPAAPVAEPHLLVGCLELLRRRGFTGAFTPALGRAEQQPFLSCGFTVHERLHLLEHDLRSGLRPPSSTWRLRRHHHGELAELLGVDALAFDDFWRFDEPALRQARRATPSSRLRVIGDQGCRAYAVTGRADTRGYVQRLAVHPGSWGQGMGSALVLDGLAWLRRHGAERALVNTQESNQRALALYRRLGFVSQPDGLAVLFRALEEQP